MRRLAVLAIAFAACGKSDGAAIIPARDKPGDASVALDSGGFEWGDGGPNVQLTSIAIQPANASLVSVNRSRPEQTFTVIGHYSNGTSGVIERAEWDNNPVLIGEIDPIAGRFVANGVIGGQTTVRARVRSFSGGADVEGTATLEVRLSYNVIVPGAPQDADMHFSGRLVTNTASAAQVVYPLDRAVMPQNVYPATLQWLNGAPGDIFRVTLTKPHMSMTAYVAHTGGDFANAWLVDANAWRPLAQTDPDDPAIILIDRYAAANGQTYASSDPVQIRFAKAAVTGSVYYWDIAAGRIRRIDDGTADAVEFMPTPPVAMDGSRCVGCHTVSRAGGTWPGASAAARTSARFSI